MLTLADADTGQPLAVMDAIAITSLRTAAVSGLAARHLARPDAACAAIIGCGEQGEAHARVLASVRPLRRLRLFDIEPARAETLAVRLTRETGLDVSAEASLDAALHDADLVATCTTSATPFLRRDHLRPGCFVAAVGADNPSKHEIEPAALGAGSLVVDAVDACAAGGELYHALAAGVLRRLDVRAELAAVVAGRDTGRRDVDEVVIFDSVGTAIQDVAAAALVYRRAVEAGLGLAVDLTRQ